ncbi:hypothetical protein RQP46_006768 [Phenoliferia psychrophenolica]
MATSYPPFAYSLFVQPGNRGNLAYKVLGGRVASKAGAKPATPLVMVHGLSAVGLVDWLPLADKLAETRPVLIFDNRGIGGSTLHPEREAEEYRTEDLAGDVEELIKHIGWKEVDLLGFSMGGMIVQQLLVSPHQLPFKVRHVVLAATSAKAAHSDLLSAIPSAAPGGVTLTLEDKIKLVTPFIHIGYDAVFLADPKNKALLDQRVLESVYTRRPGKTIARQVQTIATYDVRKRLQLIPSTLPVLIIHGTKDRSVYYSERKYLERGIPHAQIAKLPREEIGHMWYDYFTVEYWDSLLCNFLDGKPASAPGPTKARL